MTKLSTVEVAQKVGIGRATLERWLATGKVPMPKTIQFGKSEFRDWTAADVELIREFKRKNYCKGRGRKPRRRAK